MGGAPRHCSLRPRTHHGPWSPPIHHDLPRPRIFYGHLENSLPLSLRLYVLSLSLVSRFPLGPSLCSALEGACLVCSALVGACLVCSALEGDSLVCSALVGDSLVCSALVGACLVCSALVGACLVCSALVGDSLVCSALVGTCLVCSALVGACLVCSARVTSRLRRSTRVSSRHSSLPSVTSRLCCLFRPALVGSCLIGSSWTWPSIPCPGSTSAPPPSWSMLCVKRLEAALRGGLCHESGCHSLQLHITHGLHLPSCTALTHSHPPLHQSHSCHHSLISLDCLTTPAPHSHTHI